MNDTLTIAGYVLFALVLIIVAVISYSPEENCN
jgi:hypothetical protein